MRAGGFDKISPIEAPIDQGLRAADRSDVNRCMSVRPPSAWSVAGQMCAIIHFSL